MVVSSFDTHNEVRFAVSTLSGESVRILYTRYLQEMSAERFTFPDRDQRPAALQNAARQ